MCATPLPVQSEMLFTHWSAASASPQQHELASPADRFVLVRDQSVTALLDGGLRGVIIWSRKLWNVHLHRSSQRADVLDPGVTALLVVPVGRPWHWGLWHSRVSHSVHEVGDVLGPTSLILIASPMLCSPTIKRSTVAIV